MSRKLIHNGEIVNEGRSFHGYVVIDGEKIAEVGEGKPSEEISESCGEIYDVHGAMVMAGAIDDQVHFRDPGMTHKADIPSESRAAAAGGVTTFMEMPNTVPQTVTIEALEAKNRRAEATSAVNYSFYMGATNNNIEEIKKVDFTKTCGVKVFLGSSTGNMLVDDKEALRRIFSEVPALVAIHSEDEEIIRKNKEYYTARFGSQMPVQFHPLIRNAEACYACTARAIELAEQCGTRLHVLHLSTAKEMPLFSTAPIGAKKITAEVCVHHLWFDDNDYGKLGNLIKCNPAIKTRNDREALRQALREGRLDVVATDHAPHLSSEKQGSVMRAASGMPLVQFSVIMMLEMARQGIFSKEMVVEKMSHAPAKLYHIEKRGYLRAGYYADIAVIDTEAPHEITNGEVLSKCGWTPFAGTYVHSKVIKTFVNGALVYDEGKIDDQVRGKRAVFTI